MDHLAILSPKGRVLERILEGKKKIESRWYVHKKPPYQGVAIGDTVYFKEAGKLVRACARVEDTRFYQDLTPDKIAAILEEYNHLIGADETYIASIRGKRYCTLVFLADVRQIEPFEIDKTGYNDFVAWISVPSIEVLRRKG